MSQGLIIGISLLIVCLLMLKMKISILKRDAEISRLKEKIKLERGLRISERKNYLDIIYHLEEGND